MSSTVSNVTPVGKVGMCAFMLIFVIVGVSIMGVGISNILKARASVNWPQVNGRIISSEIKSHHHSNGSSNGPTYWCEEISYSYIVNRSEMDGNRISFDNYESVNPSQAQEIVGRYPVGKEVKVHYSPNDPAESLLEPGVHGHTYGVFGFGFAFFVVGSMFFRLVLKMPVARNSQS